MGMGDNDTGQEKTGMNNTGNSDDNRNGAETQGALALAIDPDAGIDASETETDEEGAPSEKRGRRRRRSRARARTISIRRLSKAELNRVRHAWQTGIDSGDPEPFDANKIRKKARARLTEIAGRGRTE